MVVFFVVAVVVVAAGFVGVVSDAEGKVMEHKFFMSANGFSSKADGSVKSFRTVHEFVLSRMVPKGSTVSPLSQ